MPFHWQLRRKHKPYKPPPRIYSHLNQQAVLSRSGDIAATRQLAAHIFQASGLPEGVAESLGYVNRLTNAEVRYRRSAPAPVSEATIVRAVNNLENAVGAPAWGHTNAQEVRKLRMHLLIAYPELMISREPADSQGHSKALSDQLGPMEATYVAVSLVYQKMWNAEYQFSEVERRQNESLNTSDATAKRVERARFYTDILQGKSQNLSLFDLAQAGDHLFSDLSILPTDTKGGR